jgi:hypothetical protein
MFDLSPEQLLGKPTLHLPINLIVQNIGEGKVIGVFQTTQGTELLFNSDKTHQFISGDMFLRPHIVYESNHMRGMGLAGIARDGFIDSEWLNGQIFKRN